MDLGADYGGVVPDLANFAKKVIAIEIDPEMIDTLNKKAGEYKNVSVMEGDIQDPSEILEGKEIENPAMLLQGMI